MVTARPTLHDLLARLLRPFTKVEPGEVVGVALMTLASFSLLTAYYLLKTVREPLILVHHGAATKLYARAAQTVIMLGVVYVYGELAKRVGRVKLLGYVFLFFTANLALFTLLAARDVDIGLPFFLWVGVFSYTIIAQFWALAADIYDEDQGKRLFPIIGGGSSIGAVVGARFAKALIPSGTYALMGTGLLILMLTGAILLVAERRTASAHRGTRPAEAEAPDEPLAKEGAFQVLKRSRFLLLIAGLVLFLNSVNSSGEYLLDRTLVVAAAGRPDSETFVGAFKADYYFWYNSIGVALELFVVSRVFKHVGVRNALYVMPCFALAAYATGAFFPVLAVMRLVKIGENGLQYSLQDTTRHALFLGTTRAEKFVGKTAIDTVAVRLGAIMSAVTVFVGNQLAWSISTFAIINVALAVAWIGFAVAVGRESRRRERERAVAPGLAAAAPAPAAAGT